MKFAIQPQQESPIVGSFILNVLEEISEDTLSLAEAGDVLLTFVKLAVLETATRTGSFD